MNPFTFDSNVNGFGFHEPHAKQATGPQGWRCCLPIPSSNTMPQSSWERDSTCDAFFMDLVCTSPFPPFLSGIEEVC